MNIPYQPEHIPTLAEILSAPLPELCYGPMVINKPPGSIDISEMTDDEKKVLHYYLKVSYETDLFSTSMDQRFIAWHKEHASKPFDSKLHATESQKESEEHELLEALQTKQSALKEILFNMIYLRLPDHSLPPSGFDLILYENFQIGMCYPEDLDDG
jgi:hypothetical protein